MIPKEELRIGNLVHYIGTDDVQVVQGVDQENVFLDCITLDYTEFEEIFPIEITEEWLLRLGFKENSFTTLYDHTADCLCNIEFSDDETYILYKNGSEIAIFSSVHQLQNLYFALEGKELELCKE